MTTLPRFSASFYANRDFGRDENGTVALMFALMLAPMAACAAGAIDYSNAVRNREALSASLDAAGLSLAHDAKRLSDAELNSRAQALFAASFGARAGGAIPTVTVTRTPTQLLLSASSTTKTFIGGMVGVKEFTVGAKTAVAYASPKIEVTLVLDNTGSMAWSGKMDALKQAARSFVDDISAKAKSPGDVKVSIVPFSTQVRVSPSRAGESWLANAPYGWTGCISDRDQPKDVVADSSLRHPAAGCDFGFTQLRPIVGLTDLATPGSSNTLKAAINAMQPEGATNITIGLVWGMQTLTPNSPFPGAAPFNSGVQKFVVLLTDGDNTKNRWDGNGSSWSPAVDQRTMQACNNLKQPGAPVTVYTIRVMAGNANLLRSCATSPDKYYEAQDAAQIQPAFKRILESIMNIRLTA